MNTYLLLLPIVFCALGALLSPFVFKTSEKKHQGFLFFVVLITSIITWILLFTVKGEKFI